MRIALLTDGITPYVTGGMQRHSFNLCRYLALGGVHVDLYHCDPAKRGAASLDCFSESEKKNISGEVIEFPNFGKMPGHYIRESYEYSQRIAARVMKKPPVDFIYAKGFCGWELLHRKSKGEKLPPIGVNLHGYEMFQEQPNLKSRLQAILYLRSPVQFIVRHADYLFSYGGKITDVIRSIGTEDSRIVSIPGGIGEEWLAGEIQNPHQPLRFLFVGRDERRKGIKELNAAIRILNDTQKGKFEFTAVGPITPASRVVGGNYEGEITNPTDLRRIYGQNDVLVVPSHSEGMPNVILEAMASGMAVIATNVGAVSALVDGTNGWVMDKPDPQIIARAMSAALNCPADELAAMKKTSIAKVKSQFTWPSIANQTIEFLNGVVK